MRDPLRMDLISQVSCLGGITDRATLINLRDRHEVDQALRDGVLIKDARGRFALPSTLDAVRVANAAHGTASHRSAALALGWPVKTVPTLPEVTVPRNRKVTAKHRRLFAPHWADLAPHDIHLGRTSLARTLSDCLRSLPFDEALAVADSALRADDLRPEDLLGLASRLRGHGRAQAIRVAREATSAAANPFESVLRAIALDVPGLNAQAQFPVRISDRLTFHPDLGDPSLRLAIEAEGFEWHGKSAQLTKDCIRYNALAAQGWVVVRFSWALVMHDPAYVAATLRAVVRRIQTCTGVTSG